MIGGKNILGVIPARGGSKRVLRKNLREIGGRPLIAWTIIEAKKSRYIDRLIVSSEDDEIIEKAKEWGCEVPFKRPAELAEDETSGVEPALHALETVPGFEYVVLLQPTSPLRSADDIDGCIEKCVAGQAPCVVSVTRPEKSPDWMYTLDEAGRLHSLFDSVRTTERRQTLPPVYMLNGAVYVARSSWLRHTRAFVTEETVGFIMDSERSVDIDSELDLITFKAIIAESRHANS